MIEDKHGQHAIWIITDAVKALSCMIPSGDAFIEDRLKSVYSSMENLQDLVSGAGRGR